MYEEIKHKAIIMLKNGFSREEIKKKLNIPYYILEEWESDLTESEKMSQELNVLATQKACSILEKDDVNNEELLKIKLNNIALKLVDEMRIYTQDVETAKAINISADTLSKLHNAFFSKANSISVVNNNANVSSDEINAFRNTLKD